MAQEHRDADEAAIDLVKRPDSGNSHHHVPVIASTGRVADGSTSPTTLTIAHGAGAAEVSSASSCSIEQVRTFEQAETQAGESHHLYSSMTTNKNDSEPNVTVCESDTLQRTNEARQQPAQQQLASPSSTSTSSAASSVLGSSGEQQSSASDRHSESSDYGSKSSKDRESPFSSPDEGIDMEEAEVDFKNSAQSKVSATVDLSVSFSMVT